MTLSDSHTVIDDKLVITSSYVTKITFIINLNIQILIMIINTNMLVLFYVLIKTKTFQYARSQL